MAVFAWLRPNNRAIFWRAVSHASVTAAATKVLPASDANVAKLLLSIQVLLRQRFNNRTERPEIAMPRSE